jgi:hypothetical protein
MLLIGFFSAKQIFAISKDTWFPKEGRRSGKFSANYHVGGDCTRQLPHIYFYYGNTRVYSCHLDGSPCDGQQPKSNRPSNAFLKELKKAWGWDGQKVLFLYDVKNLASNVVSSKSFQLGVEAITFIAS